MASIDEHLAFIQEQITFNERMAAKNKNGNGQKFSAYSDRACKFKELLEFLEDMPLSTVQPNDDGEAQRLTLMPEDIEGLPPELLEQLSISESDLLDFKIIEIIQARRGLATLDQIIIDLYQAPIRLCTRGIRSTPGYIV